jgi:hypothetical protein
LALAAVDGLQEPENRLFYFEGDLKMTKQELEKSIGLVITSGEYADIVDAYLDLPESADEDKFVKSWLQNGGIQDLFDKRLEKARRLLQKIEALKEKLAAIVAVATDEVAA